MGYTITVTLDLWCGNKDHRFPYHGQFNESTMELCMIKAGKTRWTITNPKDTKFDRKGGGHARCPMCTRGEKVT
jgi:hypothetical protein